MSWDAALFDMCSDGPTSCMCALFVPFIKYPIVAMDAGFGICESVFSLFFPGWVCVSGGLVRMEIRHRRGIPGSLFSDICVCATCAPCALIQMSREVHVGLQQNDT